MPDLRSEIEREVEWLRIQANELRGGWVGVEMHPGAAAYFDCADRLQAVLDQPDQGRCPTCGSDDPGQRHPYFLDPTTLSGAIADGECEDPFHETAPDLSDRQGGEQGDGEQEADAEGARRSSLVGEVCRRCGGENPPWSAPSPLWNAVMRGGSINGGPEPWEGIICTACFIALAEQQGLAGLWRLDAERVNVELETVTPSGRVWDQETWRWTDPQTPARQEPTNPQASPAPAPPSEPKSCTCDSFTDTDFQMTRRVADPNCPVPGHGTAPDPPRGSEGG